MLVLTRKEGQTIVIGGGIEVRIAEVQGSRVRIAINAPKEVSIMRGELADEGLVEAVRQREAEPRRTLTPRHCC